MRLAVRLCQIGPDGRASFTASPVAYGLGDLGT
ncbi:hypothetical protein PUN4_640064 [Paraburkholderia unamae]|nr:hypothetical protein PUN4_640064 [Paraburkholderia unamae]